MSASTTIGLGWRIHSWWAVAVAVSGPAESPVIVRRDRVTLIDDESLREPFHAAVAVPISDAPGLIESVERAAVVAAAAAIRELVASLGPVAAVGVVGGGRHLPADLPRILSKHALLHAAERDLYERAVVRGAIDAGLPVSTVAPTKALFDDASEVLGVALGPTLAALSRSIGPPWQKDHKEAAAAALVALEQRRHRDRPGMATLQDSDSEARR